MRRSNNTCILAFKATVWVYNGPAPWHFVTLPKTMSAKIKEYFGMLGKAWGSLPVRATIGKTAWQTSLFPDRKLGSYILPLKKEIRSKETISAGSTLKINLTIQP